MRVQAIDFWVRNPDYLAWELIEQFEQSGKTEEALLQQAEQVMAGEEPELRRLGMFVMGAVGDVLCPVPHLRTACDVAYWRLQHAQALDECRFLRLKQT